MSLPRTAELGISTPGEPGDVGIGAHLAFPVVAIEDVVLIYRSRNGVLNADNFPFRVGRRMGTDLPDDAEFIVIQLGQTPCTSTAAE